MFCHSLIFDSSLQGGAAAKYLTAAAKKIDRGEKHIFTNQSLDSEGEWKKV